ncbi:SGNH/GDSL hydrolase family protein [Specibacter sp. RAF43]|uniref:SGNH/GDSL hydrolase family protein n=1 Tax=Specibacter sp. RAF43 TaxID=3233057 RepID=UPI003F9E37DB
MKPHSVKKLGARLGAAMALAGGLVLGLAGAPALAVSQPVTYTVLGDSYSAGSGGGDESGPCLQSPHGYANDYAAATHQVLLNLACYGATIEQVGATQVPAIPSTTRLITLTVGANDIGTGAVSAACLAGPQTPACKAALSNALTQLTKLPTKIKALVKLIKAKAPRAKLAFVGYPRLFEPANMAALGYPADQVQTAKTLNGAADLLNAVVAVSALTNGARFVPVAWKFAGHGIPSADQWLIAPFGPSPFAFHPNTRGYLLGYTAALGVFL